MKVIRIGIAPQARIRERMLAIARGDLSRTLKTMSRYGLVKLVRFDRQVRPVADAERYQIVA